MSRKWKSMGRLKARICDERGLTLMELLAVITVLAIVGSVLTSTLVTGQKIYMKQTAETQFREDADYVTTRIMNELYSIPFDEVMTCKNTTAVSGTDTSCIKMIDNTDTSFNAVQNANQASATDYYYDPVRTNKSIANETTISIIDEQVQIEQTEIENGQSAITRTEILKVPSSFQVNSDGSPSFELAACSAETETGTCQSGTIKLLFTLGSDRTTEKLQLESRFGF
ncbi:prepilin-type N-terminal cleavage/methylation domain-containing protein [Domibacillus sp. DTU_2020_1001157_1_SI_ALB_TIR_016]|uniref:PilW family protein n=1 Tax=Domibacillus sp. DTU_2020_1001157_1_SI_ALB_TIR_016 TaxID=3077789 RepID=UPI0028EE52A7|nr:prepilin-type N-terminal cleavage/methylation domain-containing protein [Domibacillus sp. DTU_2020_1001157_1_SI_ALB_TIR_016]WNS81807.1 prepilin-type N-terminal cleavage/methylation domain-containing protein [Domibacillus sp. DTU_2020_1001157_1_SI_ALB_TIR_016]